MTVGLEPQISVLMPAYRPNPTWLRVTIDSLISQTYSSWQLVLSLDGDDSETMAAAQIAREKLSKEHKLIVVQGARSGITDALNRGLSACNTAYTARLDTDDICRPRRLEQQWGLLEQEASLVACGMQIEGVNADGQPLTNRLHKYPTKPTTTILVGAIFNTPIAHPVLMTRTEAIKRIGGYRELPCMEDYDLMARLLQVGNITNLAEVGLDYRVHSSQHSRQIRPMRSQLLEARWRFMKQLLRHEPTAVALVWLPLVLYTIGPGGEYRMRRLVSSFAAAIKRRYAGNRSSIRRNHTLQADARKCTSHET